MSGKTSINKTGGIGHHYEDRVAAYLLAAALLGTEPRAGLQPTERLEFQVAASGWVLDDLLLTGREGSRLTLSIKSSAQATNGGVADDFVRGAWSELCGVGCSGFREEIDLIGLVAPPPDAAVAKALDELIRWAAMQDPVALAERIDTKGAVSDIHRALWRSLACPEELAEGIKPEERSPARLLRRMRYLGLDLMTPGSADQAQAVLWCGLALVEPAERNRLWDELLKLVAEVRINGGFIEVDRVPAELADFEFAERLDFRGDWGRLRALSEEGGRRVRDTIAGVRVARDEEIGRLEAAVASSAAVALVGPSGCGKTVIARQWLERSAAGEVLWLGGAHLARLEQGSIGLRHRVEEVIAAAPGPLTIVVDGLDRQFEEWPFRLVARVLELSETGRISVVLTCQVQEFVRVSDKLRSLNAEVKMKPVAVGSFDARQLAAVLRELPQLRQLSGRSRLAAILRRPKVLDMFASRSASSPLPSERSGDDETAVAAWFWEMALGGGADRQGRAATLMRLAREQGDRLLSSTPREELGDTAPIDELERDGIVEVVEGRVSFAHDLYADWSRYQVLLSQSEERAEFLAERIGSPLWHRAIRLHALSLLRGEGSRWGEELRTLGGEDPSAIHDVFLDALVFAADPETAIESAWELLVADCGRLLNRFLSRFRHTATVPDPYLMSAFRGMGADVAVVAAAKNRVPYTPLWPPVLSVLLRHGEEVVELADVELAETLNLWLRRRPADEELRRGCATLALRGAERILEQAAEPRTHVAGELIALHLRAALATAGEDPERLRALLGALTEPEPVPPRPEGARAAQGRSMVALEPFDADEEEPPLLGYGTLEAFRELVLDSDALIPVVTADPELAAELIEAAIIPPQRRRRRVHHPLEDYGVPDFHKWSSPLWLRGPFLPFLRADPERAIAMIAAIVNEASDRYMAALDGEVRELLPEATIEIEGRSPAWPGNEVVYLFYRGDSRAPKTVASALMALEKWFYEKIEAEEDIRAAVGQVMAESRSLAFAGLLIAVGYRRPELFKGPLRPLLGVAELYRLEHIRIMQSGVQYKIGLSLEPQLMQNLIREWHEMGHRKIELERAAQQLLLGDPELAEWMQGVLGRWREEGREENRHLAARLDVGNWVAQTLEDGRQAWSYEHPPDLAAESAEALAESEERLFWLQFPHRMRTAVDAENDGGYSDEDFERLWEEVVEAKAMTEPPAEVTSDGVVSALDARCGVAAFLVLRGREWLRRHPEREAWCRETLLAAGCTPLKSNFMDSAEDISDWSYDRFCADALPALWAEEPKGRAVREAIAVLATNMHLNTISRLHAAAAERREVLGAGFGELQSLALAVAGWKTKRTLATQTADEEAAKTALEELKAALESFAAAELEVAELDLRDDAVDSAAEHDEPPPSAQPFARRRRRRRRRRSPIDLRHVWAAWSWMPDFAAASNEGERLAWLRFWQQMVGRIAARIAAEPDSYSGGPYEHENAILLGLPERVLSLADPEEARSLWQPLLATGVAGERWISSFFTAWFAVGLADDGLGSRFAERWEEMLEFASENWSQDAGADAQACWRSLLGIGRWQPSGAWGSAQAPLISSLRRFYEAWAVGHLVEPQSFDAFCRFLAVPAAAPLLEPGLCWLQASRQQPGAWRRERGQEDLLSLLTMIATRSPALPRARSEAGAAYRELLAAEVERHDPVALALHERIFAGEGADS
ncbi:MAG TPA: ABC transporter ATP-binding protein [Solirubrobacterales bacterium]|nr:ABC transporter ATP-binding protein [Solirubrobacterales bacterium]